MGHYDDGFDAEVEKRLEQRKQRVESLKNLLQNATELIKCFEQNPASQRVYDKLREAQMWTEELY